MVFIPYHISYPSHSEQHLIRAALCLKNLNIYTGHTQKNGAISSVNVYNTHHSFVYALYKEQDKVSLYVFVVTIVANI
jgi:hypothetical protein